MPGNPGEHQRGQGRQFTPKPPEVTTAELGQVVNGHLNTLLEAVKQGKTERFTQFLTFSGKFHRYSRRNQELIFEQCPQATRVASYKKWKDEGYQVRKLDKAKNERGIRILVPIPPQGYKAPARREAKQVEQESDERKEIGFVTSHFHVGTVFDVSHLIPEDQQRIPQFFTAIHGDHEALHTRIVTAVQTEGIAYRESVDTDGAQGYSAMGLIVVRPDQPSGNKAAVTVHEWAHELLHKEEQRRTLPKQVKEAHAEATAFIVLSHFGVEIPYSADYLAMWGNTPQTLREELDKVTFAASHIITKLHGLEPGEAYFHDPTEADIQGG